MIIQEISSYFKMVKNLFIKEEAALTISCIMSKTLVHQRQHKVKKKTMYRKNTFIIYTTDETKLTRTKKSYKGNK